MNNRQEFEQKIDFAISECNVTSFQYETIKDVAWILKNDYNVDETQILDNLSRLQSVQVVDKDYKADWTGVLNTGKDGSMNIKYKDVDDEVEKRGVLTHELIHCLASNEYENGFHTGLKVDEKYRFLNEIVTEGLANEVMQKMGYELSDVQRGYYQIIDYGDALLKTNLREDFVNNYFSKNKSLLESNSISIFGNSLYHAWNSQIDDNLNLYNNTNYLHQGFIYLAKDKEMFSKNNMSESNYSDIIKLFSNNNFKELNLKEEDIRILNYGRYSNNMDVNLAEYIDKNSNFNKSLDVIRDIQKKFPGEEIDLKNIKFVSIEEDNQKKIVYCFNDKNYIVGNNYTKEISFDGKFTEKMFKDNNFFKHFKEEFKDMSVSQMGFKNVADIFKDTSWRVYMQTSLEKMTPGVANFVANGVIDETILSFNQWRDKDKNNILHLIGYDNNSLINNGNIVLNNGLTSKVDVALAKMMSERNNDGLTPFEEAVKSKNVAAIKFFSEKIEDLKIKDFTSGNLDFYDNINTLKYMLKEENLNGNYKSISNFIKTFEADKTGIQITPLEIMVQEKVTNGKLLCEISSDDFNFETKRGNTLTYLTSRDELNVNFVHHLLNREDINVNAKDECYERAPLHNLLYNSENRIIIERLVELGADVNARCVSSDDALLRDGKEIVFYITPIQLAYGMDEYGPKTDYQMVEFLVKNGADVKAETNMYPSVLETMHEKGDIEGLKALINAGMSSKEIIDDYKSNSNVSENDLKDLVKYEAETKSHLNIDKEDVKDKSVNADIDMEM